MKRRIALIGANGKVGSEVTMLLKAAGCDVVPVCRGVKGSAQLRYRGIAVRHGSMERLDEARRLIGDAEIVMNFALPSGVPAESRQRIGAILENCFLAAPGAMQIFCSTLVAHRGFQAEGRPVVLSRYGREKRDATALVLGLAKRSGRGALVVRLGHVAGALQPISRTMREMIAAGPVALPHPERAANLIHTVAIADLVRRAAEEEWRDEGVRDLVDQPALNWRRAFEIEAAQAGLPLSFAAPPPASATAEPAPLLRRLAGGIARQPQLRSATERVLAKLPDRFNRNARIQHLIAQNAAEIAALPAPAPPPTDALTYPAVEPDLPPGLRDLDALLADPRYRLPATGFGPRWPADLPPAMVDMPPAG